MQTSTAYAPSPKSDFQSDSFATFLARLAELPDWDSNVNPSEHSEPETDALSDLGVSEDDLAALSYEHALRAQSRVQKRAAQKSPKRAVKRALATQPSTTAIQIADSRRCRSTIRFTVAENELLHARAAESDLAVSAYIRSCVLEVESLRAQVRQMMGEMRSAPSPRSAYSVTEPQAPELDAQPARPVLAAPPNSNSAPRPLQPLTARVPQPGPALKLDPRVQAAFDAQKRISAQSAPRAEEKKRSGLLGFFFGTRKIV
jgi:hypothetical protein